MTVIRPIFIALVLALPVFAQTPVPTAEQFKSWIAIRQQRGDLLRDEIIDTLTTISDSKDSRTKVARMKEGTGKRLMKTINYYDQKRAALKEELSNPRLRLTAEEKQKMIAAFDARIEKRTQQIMALNKSMSGEIIAFSNVNELPAEAARDAETFLAFATL